MMVVITLVHSNIQSRQKGCPQTSGKPTACPLNFKRQIGQLAVVPSTPEDESELAASSSPLSASDSVKEDKY